jgi:hypothetical protein
VTWDFVATTEDIPNERCTLKFGTYVSKETKESRRSYYGGYIDIRIELVINGKRSDDTTRPVEGASILEGRLENGATYQKLSGKALGEYTGDECNVIEEDSEMDSPDGSDAGDCSEENV